MSGNKKLVTVCQPYFNTNSCPNGEKCILKHIAKESVIPSSVHPSQTDKGRTFAILPFSCLRLETTFKPNNNNSKVSSNTSNSKSSSNSKFKTPATSAIIMHNNNMNNLNRDTFPSLSKAQKKRNRRKGKATTNEQPTKENIAERISEKNLCLKSKGDCVANCKSLHGDICDLCSRPVLHPLNAQFRREHSQQCIREHEEKMKEVLATVRSADMQCGICFEPVMQKKGDCRFSILPDCNHCFCLVCIKIWRKSAGFGKAIRKSCPECRVVSHYVCPSTYWVENKDDKAQVIKKYKDALVKVNCKYFAKNQKCPFGNKCFYKHCKDGTPVDLGSPRRNRNRGFNVGHQSLMMDALFDIIMNENSDLSDFDDYDSDFVLDSDEDYDNDAFFPSF